MRRTLVVWGLAVALLVAAVSVLYLESEDRAEEARLFRSLEAFRSDLETRFLFRHLEELRWLALHPEVRTFLAEGVGRQEPLADLLKQTAGLLDLDAVYLAGVDGRIRASSSPAFLGVDVSERAYFGQSLAGRPGFAMAVGLVTQTRGLYAAVPVYEGGRVVGVAAFRTSAAALDQFLAQQTLTYLVDDRQEVFASSGPGPSRPETWAWESPTRLRADDRWYRVARQSLPSIPGISIVLLKPETWPWDHLVAIDLLLILLAVTGGLAWRSLRQSGRRRAEGRVRRHRESLLSNLLEGIAVLDLEGLVLWSNPAFRRLAETSEEEGPLRLADLWDRTGAGPWTEVLEQRRTWVVFESVLKGRQGAWTPVLAGLTAADEQLILSVLDRSERHRSDQLLRQSQKLTVLGQLSGGIAHDLNNMLGVLMGMADLLKMSIPEQDPLQESVELMLTTLARAANLAEKMLDFARQTPMARVPLDLAAVLRELRFLARTALPDQVEAEVEAPEGPIPILGDENLLLSALLNLVLNAAEAMPQGGAVLVTGQEVEAGRFQIVVADSGEGMDKETLGRIFEPFFSTKLDKKGTGLGLSLVRRTIVEHRGSIDVKSAPGEGTRVTVTLPLLPAPRPLVTG